MSAYIHSVIDYGLEIWATVSDKLKSLQSKIDSLFSSFFMPAIFRRRRKLSNDYLQQLMSSLYDKCNFINVKQRLITLKLAYIQYTKDNSFLTYNFIS